MTMMMDVTKKVNLYFLNLDIIQLVAGYPHWVTLPYRPTLTDIQFIYPEIRAVMQKCWSEDPSERPDFNALKTTIRNINK